MPSKNLSDQLVGAYLRTFESVYRILHVPTFWKDYHHFWDDPVRSDKGFTILLQLCMAIGTCFYDETCSLRNLAIQWIYEAQFWLMSPAEKSRMNIPGLQTMCLLHLARETCGVGGDLIWISAGSLMRTAMYMGLHREPEPESNVPILRAELGRRLWATVLEIALQSSIESGGPPLISLQDFDTRHPSNYDDEQLEDGDNIAPAPKPLGSFTQSTVQLALLRSFPVRLAIAHRLNDLRSTISYEETIKLNSELNIACIPATAALLSSGSYEMPRASEFQIRMVEHMTYRLILVLNNRWLATARENPSFYFSRKLCIDTSLKLYRGILPTNHSIDGMPARQGPGDRPGENGAGDFARLAVCGAGAYRSVPIQCMLSMCVELRWQLEEARAFQSAIAANQHASPAAGSGLGFALGINSGVASKEELFEALRFAVAWTETRILAGETNVKGHICTDALIAQSVALKRGASDEEVEKAVLDSLNATACRCLALLKQVAGCSIDDSEIEGEDFGEQGRAPGAANGTAAVGATSSQDLGMGLGGEWDWEDLVSTVFSEHRASLDR